ncbi:MAG TPA: tyrosine-type recombinase/integrase [Chthoniobacterales bacterium]|nr:tyrosine-type recombinase/integrase [Chthoniobacterales bacterium]
MKKVVLALCANWSGFDPQLIWKRYKEHRGADGNKDVDKKAPDLVSAPNQLRWYLRKLVPWFVKQQWLPSRVLETLAEIKNLKVNPRHPEIPSKEQIRELFCQIDLENPELGRFLKFVAMTGQRRGRWHSDPRERRGALGISWSDVDLSNHRIRVTLKGNFVKWLFISEEAVRLLEELARERNGNTTPEQQIWGFSDRKAKRASALLRKWCKAFNLEIDYLHALRHYFCSVGLSEGLSAAEVAQLAGHKDNGKLLLSVYAHVLQPVLEKKVRGFSVIQ